MQLTTRKWTLAEYQKLSEIGLLAENERIELIQGEIVAKTPVDPLHANAVAQANPMLVGVTEPAYDRGPKSSLYACAQIPSTGW